MVWAVLGATALASLGGCAASGTDSEFGNNGAGAGAANGNGSGNGNGNGNGDINDGSGSDGNGTGDDLGDDECAGTKADANREPAIIEMVIDLSGSMAYEAPGGMSGTRWDVTRAALVVALDNLAAQAPGTAVGLSFFPNESKIDFFSDNCYFPEQTVPISPLTAQHVGALKNGFVVAGSPNGGTPTHNAYHFSADQLRASSLEGNRYMLLITDGKASYGMANSATPAGPCTGNGSDLDSSSVPKLLQEVTTLFNAEQIRTFVIGVPGSDDFTNILSEMARVGGTGTTGCSQSGPLFCHFDMTSNQDLATGLAEALADISGQTLSCVYTIPTPPDGQVIDHTKINVIYTEPGEEPEMQARDGQTDCTKGWQYSPDKTQVILCGQLCDDVMEKGGKVEIKFGCAQKVD